jgi:hypothetical protein
MIGNIIYKTVKVQAPHCSTCGEQLRGNNSVVAPYHCKCGVWKQDWMTGQFTVTPIPKKDHED